MSERMAKIIRGVGHNVAYGQRIMRLIPRDGPERTLSAGMRALLGVIGITSLIAGIAVAVAQVRAITYGASVAPALLAAAMAILVAASGTYIIRGAIRGRIIVRRTGARRKSRFGT
jgi:hypothetical protein